MTWKIIWSKVAVKNFYSFLIPTYCGKALLMLLSNPRKRILSSRLKYMGLWEREEWATRKEKWMKYLPNYPSTWLNLEKRTCTSLSHTHSIYWYATVCPQNMLLKLPIFFHAMIAHMGGVTFSGKQWFCFFHPSQLFTYFSHPWKLISFNSRL